MDMLPMDMLPEVPNISELIAKVSRNSGSLGELPVPVNSLVGHAQENLASEFYKRLIDWINDFDAKLDDATTVNSR